MSCLLVISFGEKLVLIDSPMSSVLFQLLVISFCCDVCCSKRIFFIQELATHMKVSKYKGFITAFLFPLILLAATLSSQQRYSARSFVYSKNMMVSYKDLISVEILFFKWVKCQDLVSSWDISADFDTVFFNASVSQII